MSRLLAVIGNQVNKEFFSPVVVLGTTFLYKHIGMWSQRSTGYKHCTDNLVICVICCFQTVGTLPSDLSDCVCGLVFIEHKHSSQW